MWTHMLRRGDGTLRLPAQSFELGGVLVDRANKFLETHPGAEDALRRVLTLRLATLRDNGEPTRRRATRSEFSDQEWHLVSELADYPNRLLVTATAEGGESYAEVAHEAIFRRWDKLKGWIAVEREFLAWRTGLEAAHRAWADAPDGSKGEVLLMAFGLAQARVWLAKHPEGIGEADREFINQSTKRDRRARAKARRAKALVYVLLVFVVLVPFGLYREPYRAVNFDPYRLKAEAERALRPLASFRECSQDCPEMIVIPAGSFRMGSPATEKRRYDIEGPQHEVVLPRPFAVSKFDVTFADWDACVAVGGCPQEGRASDAGWGRGTQPVIYVSWDDVQAYVSWLSGMTFKQYRLLTEAEWEYAARAGSTTAYFWGEEIGKNNANCPGCGSQWDNRQTSPVGSFKPNAFGLHDMAGNVWQWVQDCYHDNYRGAPADGSAWTSGDCRTRVVRGGSWGGLPEYLRSADRIGLSTGYRGDNLGFRVGRTLLPP
jgi:formylglycine-generating enzyme required for sulfatase activity